MTRLYEPRELGILAVFIAFLSTIVSVASLRYEVAVPLPKEDEEGLSVLGVALFCVFCLAGLLGGIVAVGGTELASLARVPDLAPYLWLLPIGLLAAGTYQALSHWAVRKSAFGLLGRTRLTQALGQVGSQIAAGMVGAGAGGLVVGDVLGRSAGSGLLGSSLLPRQTLSRALQVEALRKAGRRYSRFPLFAAPAALVNGAAGSLPPFLFAFSFGPSVAGQWAIAQRVIALPVTVVGRAVSQVYLGQASGAVHTRAGLALLFRKTTVRLVILGGLLLVPIAIAAPFVFPVVFGSQWKTAGLFVQTYALAALAQFVVSPTSQTLNVTSHQHLQLIWDVGRLLSILAVFVTAAKWGLTPLRTVQLFTLVSLLLYTALFFISRKAARKSAL